MSRAERACQVLRIAVALEFAGHGLLALTAHAPWLTYVTFFGVPPELAPYVMRAIGALDVALAVGILVRPVPAALVWMVGWGFFTATLRPLVEGGLGGWLGFVERGPNWGAPLALLWLLGLPRNRAELWRFRPRD